ncbi:WcaJ Sugar transferases involved in lipopolysaccharide synthesis [Oxalobacteraceae bacterium]
MKRVVDVVVALVLSLIALPLALLIAVLIRLDSPGPIMTRSHRVGRNGRMVKVWEFRTANAEPDAMETVAGCQGEEVTRIGAVLRRLGIGRWPLLLTVLRGDLSMVGPRAELPRYVGCYPTAMRKLVLSVKPGLVDLASIEFRDEQKLLASLEGEALEEAYVEQVLPIRLEYAKRYIESQSLLMDVRILLYAAVAPLLKTSRISIPKPQPDVKKPL